MRILWLTENYPPSKGGMAQSCDRLIRNLRKAGIKIDIAHFTNRRSPFTAEQQVNGTYTALPLTEDLPHSLNLAYEYLMRHVQFSEIDCLVIFGGLAPISFAHVFSALTDKPYYLCLRGNDFDISLMSYKRRDMLLEAIRGAQGVFSVSQHKQHKVKKLVPSANSYYTPNGIDLEDWFPLKSEETYAEQWRSDCERKNKCVIGLFGALKAKKGVDNFIRCIEKGGFANTIYLLLSGDIDAAVERQLKDSNIPFTAMPFIERSELIKHYLCCDWIALPSFYDGMPNVLLESISLNIPVMGSAVDGIDDVLAPLRNICLFDPFDQPSIVATIQKALALDRKEKADLVRASYDRVATHFNTRKETQHYLDIFENDGFTL